MSRGLGRTQRAILAYIGSHDDPPFAEVVAACAPVGSTPRNTYESYRRAMRSLEAAGRIKVRKDWNIGDWRLSVAPTPRNTYEDPEAIPEPEGIVDIDNDSPQHLEPDAEPMAYRCSDCGKDYTEEDADQDQGGIFECEGCDYRFTFAEQWSNRCPNCNRFSAKVADLSCPECGEGELEPIDSSASANTEQHLEGPDA